MPDYGYISAWMGERDLVLAPGFAQNLRGLAETFKKIWRQVVDRAACLFGLSVEQSELLANSAGLS